MKRKLLRKIQRCMVTALVIGLSAGCRKEADSLGRPVKLGTILGLTGDNAAYGIRMKKGLDLALDRANSLHGASGLHFELVVEDSQWEPRLGINAYRKMHDVDGVRHFVAICGSKIALAVAEASRQDDIVIVDAISGAPKLTTHAGPKYFRVYASDAMAGKANVNWALEKGLGAYAVAYVEDDWGSSYKDAVVAELGLRGKTPSVIPISVAAKDLKTEAQKILAENPDALFAVLYANLALPLVRELRTLGYQGVVFGGDNLSSSDFSAAGPAVTEGVRLSLPAEASSESFRTFEEAFVARFGEKPDSFALKSYDALMLMAHAVVMTDSQPSSIVQFLREMPGYDGASGVLSFDEHGDLKQQVYQRMLYRDGKLVPSDDR